MAQARVSVCVVCYNNRDFIGDCLESVGAQDYPEVETVLVDNASTDGSPEFVGEKFPRVRIIRNGCNLLFCGGQNIGIRNTSGEFFLALNSDVVLDRGFISAMVEAAGRDPKTGSVSGKIMRTGGDLIDTTGLFLGRDRRPVERGYGEPDTGRYDEPGFIFGAGGAAPLYRREMLDDVSAGGGYFDEGYGAFYEDLDLAWRANRRGWKAYYTPAAVAWHLRGGTARKERRGGPFSGYAYAGLSDGMKARLLANRYMTMIKNDTAREFVRDLPFIALYELKIWAWTAVFAPGTIPAFMSNMRALKDAWRRRKTVHGS